MNYSKWAIPDLLSNLNSTYLFFLASSKYQVIYPSVYGKPCFFRHALICSSRWCGPFARGFSYLEIFIKFMFSWRCCKEIAVGNYKSLKQQKKSQKNQSNAFVSRSKWDLHALDCNHLRLDLEAAWNVRACNFQ